MADFVYHPEYERFATPKQLEKLRAWHEHGSARKAAQALGIDHACIVRALRRVKKKAAQHGFAPEYDLTHPAAPGMTIQGTSIRYDGDNNVQQYWNKTKKEGRAPEEAYQMPDPKKVIKVSTLSDQEGRVTQQWVVEKPEAAEQAKAWEEFAKALAEEIPKAPEVPAPEKLGQKDLLACYPIGDHHLGMLAWHGETTDSYDMKRGEHLLAQATDHLVNIAPNSENALVVFLGDFLHYDSFEPVTPTSHNQLDSDTRYPKMVRAGVRCMRRVVEAAAAKHHKVHVIIEIGNHDLSSSIFLMECLRCVYENNERITVDTSPKHFHYYRFGECLIGTHHGHGVKMQQLPLTMATDRPEDWGCTKHRYWWTGHIHHSKTQAAISSQDYSGCTVESFRILAPSDSWHHQKGYRPIRDMSSILLHASYGEVARFKVNPDMFKPAKTE